MTQQCDECDCPLPYGDCTGRPKLCDFANLVIEDHIKRNAAGGNQAADQSKHEEGSNNTGKNQSEIDMTCLNDVEMKPIDWLWPERIALGKLTVISGKPGLGKSQLTALLAAHVTTGRDWPDSPNPCPAGHVVFLSAEDDPADTIKPRLMAAGANIHYCHVLEAVNVYKDDDKTSKRSFNLREDVERLNHQITSMGNVKLAVIDPISAYLGGTDSHNNADMRGLLAPLSTMAAETQTAIVLLTHENKSEKSDPINRVIGSIGLVAAARAAYSVLKDEQSPKLRYFIPLKNNIGNDSDGFAYEIEGVSLDGGIETSKVKFQPALVSAQKILNPESKTETNGAKAFLQELLYSGPKSAKDIFEEAEGAGYGKATIQRAKGQLGVKIKKQGMKGGWMWYLPTSSTPSPEGTEDAEDTTT